MGTYIRARGLSSSQDEAIAREGKLIRLLSQILMPMGLIKIVLALGLSARARWARYLALLVALISLVPIVLNVMRIVARHAALGQFADLTDSDAPPWSNSFGWWGVALQACYPVLTFAILLTPSVAADFGARRNIANNT
jgi:hypothetical protein